MKMGKDYVYQLIINWINLQQMAIVLQFYTLLAVEYLIGIKLIQIQIYAQWLNKHNGRFKCVARLQWKMLLQQRMALRDTTTSKCFVLWMKFFCFCLKDGTVLWNVQRQMYSTLICAFGEGYGSSGIKGKLTVSGTWLVRVKQTNKAWIWHQQSFC